MNATDDKTTELTRDEQRERLMAVCNASCVGSFSEIWRRNWATNWPFARTLPGVKYLWGALDRMPAIVVNAGPSLEKNLPGLLKCKDRFVIVAVDRAYPILRAAGIIPAITVTLDPQPAAASFFENHRPGDLVAVVPWQDPEIFSNIPRSDLVCYSEMTDKIEFWNDVNKTYFNGDKDYFGRVVPGGTVGFAAFQIAFGLGCNPIVFAGLDLCLTETDKKCETNAAFLASVMAYDQFFDLAPAMRIINATGAGILKSCEQMDIEDVAGQLAGPKINYAWALRKRLKAGNN